MFIGVKYGPYESVILCCLKTRMLQTVCGLGSSLRRGLLSSAVCRTVRGLFCSPLHIPGTPSYTAYRYHSVSERSVTTLQYQTLASLPLCREAYIDSLNIDGDLRRRLLDLGFSSGSSVTPLYRSPLGDPTAYHIMGSVIALRQEDADQIQISSVKKEEI